MRTALAHLRRDDGFLFLVPVLYGLLIGGVAVGGATAVESVNNSLIVQKGNATLQEGMTHVISETEGKTDEVSIETNQKAKELLGVAKKLEQENYDGVVADVRSAEVGVAVNIGTTLIGGPISAASDAQSVYQAGATLIDENFDPPPPLDGKTRDYIGRLNSVRFGATRRALKAGGVAGLTPVPATPVEGAIAETKVQVVQREVAEVTGVKFDKARKLAEEVTLDAEANLPSEEFDLPFENYGDQAKERATWELITQLPDFPDLSGLPDETVEDRQPDRTEYDDARDTALEPFLGTLEDSVDKVDPSKAKGKTGEIVLSPEDEKALKSGNRETAVGTFISPMGPEPVIVTPGDKGTFTGEFPTLKSAPPIKSDSSFNLPKKQWKSWWDGSRASCPFVYVFDGESFSAVNDIISVSRDPEREYVDRMLFGAKPGSDGTLEVRVNEIRSEESFIDRIVLRAIDVPDGYEAALSPDGRAFSVRDAAPPIATTGTPLMTLAFADGEGFAAYDGGAVTAEFAAPGPDAVLLVTVDGFELDGSTPRFTPKRPAIHVEAFADGSWHSVGEAHPRERTDITAFDMAPFVRAGRVRARVVGVSCDASVYQLVDRLALSAAPSGLARMRRLSPKVEGPKPGAASLLSARDGQRAHLVPGQGLRFVLPGPGADAYVIESVGWYREVRSAGM